MGQISSRGIPRRGERRCGEWLTATHRRNANQQAAIEIGLEG